MLPFSRGSLPVVIVSSALLAALSSSCDSCSEPPGPPAVECVLDGDCGDGLVCADGTCAPAILSDAGPGNDAGPGDDAGTPDAGAALGVLTVLPEATVDFGATRLGIAVERNITLKNTGDAPLTLLQIVIDDNEEATFAVEPAGFLDQVLEPDAEIGLALTYVPDDGSPDEAELKVLHTGEGGLSSVTLTASFKGTPVLSVTTDAAALVPDVTALDLGQAPVGATQTAELLVRNRGGSDSLLTIRSVTVTPSTGAFSVEHAPLDTALLASFGGFCPSGLGDCPAGTATCTGGICRVDDGAPIDSFVVRVTFTPVAAGEQTAIVTLGYEAVDGSLLQRDIALAGEGTSGALLIAPGAVNFDNAFVGRASTQVMTIQNVGSANLTLDDVSLDSGAAWELVNAPLAGFVLVPNGQTQLTARIVASTPGTFDDVLRVTAGSDEATATLHADAREAPEALIPDALAFGNVSFGGSLALPLVIRNGGPGDLRITGLSLSGSGAARYAIALPQLPSTVAPLAAPDDQTPNLSVNVTYTPGVPTGGFDLATLRVDTDDPDVPFVDVELSGQAIDPTIVIVDNSLDFGTLDVGTSATQQVEVRNNGFGALVVTSLNVNPVGSFTAAAVGGLPATVLLGGNSLFIDVEFTAQGPGAAGATLTIASNDGNASVSLVGSGRVCDTLPGTSFVQNGAQCTYSCLAGFVDLDGDLNTSGSDGCEYQCTFVNANDTPDNGFVDLDCDGVDGDLTRAIFVADTGADTNDGSIAAPFRTLQRALTAATAGARDQILVSAGNYPGAITLKNGVSVFGGYEADQGWGRSDSPNAIINVPAAVGARVVGVTGSGIITATVLDRLSIRTGAALSSGASNYAVHCTTCTALTISNSDILAGAGGDGVAGAAGNAGTDGSNGSPGGAGCCDCGSAPRFGGAAGGGCRAGGRGGDGGTEGGSGNAQAGSTGQTNVAGGPGGGGGDPGRGGTGGTNGPGGDAGSDGAGGNGAGSVTAGFWGGDDGNNGGNGTDGNGGGGGGGGGGQDCTFCDDGDGNGGGGGGGGGCGGELASGGTAGGGSFGVFLVASSGAQLIGNVISAGLGGDGGSGGRGGDGGGGGGSGAGATTCTGEVGRGGNGGAGGAGGRGGHGGGGGGGASFAVYRFNSSVDVSANALTAAGGGAGGASFGSAGASGDSGQAF